MKNTLRKAFERILCVVLSLVMLGTLAVHAFAVEKTIETQYVKDVTLIYAESLSEARSLVPEGYTLLEHDLNEGTEYVYDVYQVYLAYTTTVNPEEAITDIKMMNMKGGFAYSDYEEQIENVDQRVRTIANELMTAAEVFKENYVKGTYGAMAAYRALSFFTVDEANSQTLADYMIYGEPTDSFYIKLILNAHRDIISTILSALTMAVQGEEGNTWLDRLAKIEDPKDIYDNAYWDQSCALWESFNAFNITYSAIDHDLYRKNANEILAPGETEDDPPKDISDPGEGGNTEAVGAEVFYEIAYICLEQYAFGNGVKFSDYFVTDDLWEENLYCLIEVMTPAEYAMMHLCGPMYMTMSTVMNEKVYNHYINSLDEITEGEEKCSVWEGVNTELFRSSIGITDVARRALAESEYERELNNEGESTIGRGLRTAGLIAAAGLVSAGVGLAGLGLFAGSFGAMLTGGMFSSAAVVLTVASTFFIAAGIAAAVIALVVVIVYFGIWLAEWWDEHHPEYTEIPEYMYDYVEDTAGNCQFVLYEGVRFQDGKMADVNAWEGHEWHAMYVSRDQAAGAPIEADFIVRHADGHIDKGYAGLANFGQVNAENLNHYADDDEVNGIYVTYRQEDLTGDYARGKYLSDVKLFSDEDENKCKVAVENENYVLYNVNLTPDADYYTYLGYKTSNHESRARTDIRIAYGYNSAQYSAGGGSATYAASGSTLDGRITLYTTKISAFGTPILSDFLVLNDRNAPAGYEPVNLFSGGPAVNLNMDDDGYVSKDKGFYLYFLPSQTYTSGTAYLGGITAIYDDGNKFYDNGAGSVDKANKILGYDVLYRTQCYKDDLEGVLGYTTTYNPYRAIYGITAVKESDTMGSYFSQTITYDGVGYVMVDRYTIDYNSNVAYESHARNPIDVRLYVAGVCAGGTPLTVSDLYVTADQSDMPEGFVPVSARLSDDGRAVDLAGGFYRRHPNSRPGRQPTIIRFDSFYLFVRGEEYRAGNYVTNLYLTSKEQVLGGMDLSCDNLDNSYVVNTLAAQGAHTMFSQNLNLKDSDNTTYLGYTKAPKTDSAQAYPITDVVLYYAGKTNQEPKTEILHKGITYHLVSDVNIFCKENEERANCARVYLYYTTNPAAGSPILDIKIDNTAILNGWETVRTQNGLALYDDMDAYEGSMWFIHLKRTIEDPKYISEVVVGVGGSDASAKAVLIAAGCDYMLEKDFNNNVGAHSDYIYIGYKRTSDPNKAIRDLRTTHDDEVDSFVKNGVTYYKIEGNLNSYTNIFADDIFLYYTRDPQAGTPLISLGTSQHVANWTHGEGNRYVVTTVLNQYDEGSDLNDGCGYQSDYIYLLQTRDKEDGKATASIMGNGSIVVVIACVAVSVLAVTVVSVAQKKRRARVEAGQDTPPAESEG